MYIWYYENCFEQLWNIVSGKDDTAIYVIIIIFMFLFLEVKTDIFCWGYHYYEILKYKATPPLKIIRKKFQRKLNSLLFDNYLYPRDLECLSNYFFVWYIEGLSLSWHVPNLNSKLSLAYKLPLIEPGKSSSSFYEIPNLTKRSGHRILKIFWQL